MNLSNFLTDCRDSNKTVQVTEKQLRLYAQSSAVALARIKELDTENDILTYKNRKLQERVAYLESKEPITIDLFA